jgi:hypothetical protein
MLQGHYTPYPPISFICKPFQYYPHLTPSHPVLSSLEAFQPKHSAFINSIHATCPTSPRINHLNHIWWGVQTMKVFMEFLYVI